MGSNAGENSSTNRDPPKLREVGKLLWKDGKMEWRWGNHSEEESLEATKSPLPSCSGSSSL